MPCLRTAPPSKTYTDRAAMRCDASESHMLSGEIPAWTFGCKTTVFARLEGLACLEHKVE